MSTIQEQTLRPVFIGDLKNLIGKSVFDKSLSNEITYNFMFNVNNIDKSESKVDDDMMNMMNELDTMEDEAEKPMVILDMIEFICVVENFSIIKGVPGTNGEVIMMDVSDGNDKLQMKIWNYALVNHIRKLGRYYI